LLATLSAAQLRQLSGDAVAALSGEQLAQITLSAAGLSPAQVARMSAIQIGRLGGATNLSPAALATLDATELAALSEAGNWQGISMAQIAALAPTAITGLSLAALASLAPATVAAMSADQLAQLSARQMAALATPARLSVAALTSLTAAQAQAIVDWSGFSAAQVAAIPAAALAGLDPAQLARWTSLQLGGLSFAQSSVLSAQQLAALPASALAALTPSGLGGLSPAALAALSAAQWDGFDNAQLGRLNAKQVGAVTPALMASLTPRVVGALAAAIDTSSANGKAQLAALDARQRAALPAVPDAALTASGWRTLKLTQVAALTPAQLSAQRAGWTLEAALTADQLRVLSTSQFAALRQPGAIPVDAVGAISAAQLAALPASVWATLPAAFVAALAPSAWSQLAPSGVDNSLAQLPLAALNALSAAQLAQFGAAARAALPALSSPLPATSGAQALALWQLAGLTPAQLAVAEQLAQSLSGAQLAVLSPSQIAALAHPERLSVQAVAALSGEQALALAPASWSLVSAAWLGALQPATIAALATPAGGAAPAASLWSTAAVAGLTAPQLAAMSPQQFSQMTALAGLTPAQIQSLSSVQIGALSATQAASLTGTQIAAFSAAQIAQLPAVALAAMSPLQVLQLFNNSALQAQPDALSDYQLQNLNGSQRALLAVGAPGLAPIVVTVMPSGGITTLTRLQLAAMPDGSKPHPGVLDISDLLAASPADQRSELLLGVVPLLSYWQLGYIRHDVINTMYAGVLADLYERARKAQVNTFSAAIFGADKEGDQLFAKALSRNTCRLLLFELAAPDGVHVDPEASRRLAQAYLQTYDTLSSESDEDQFSALFLSAPDLAARYALIDSLAGKQGKEATAVLSGYADTNLAAGILLPGASVAQRQEIADTLALLQAGPQRAELFTALQQTEQRVSGGAALLAGLLEHGVANGADPDVLSTALAESMPVLSSLTSSSTLAGLSRNLVKWEGLSRAVFTVMEENNKQLRDGLLKGLGKWIEADRFAVPDVNWDHVYGSDAGTAGELAAAFKTRLQGFTKEFSTAMGVDLDSGTDALSQSWRKVQVELEEKFGFDALQRKGSTLSAEDEGDAFNDAFGKSLSGLLDDYTPTKLSASALSKVRNQTLALRVVGSFAGFIGSLSGLADTLTDPKKKGVSLAQAGAAFKLLSELAGALDVPLSNVIKDFVEYRTASAAGVEPNFITRFQNSFKTLKAAFASLTARELVPGAASNFYTTGKGATVEASALPSVSVQTAADGRSQVLVANDTQAALDGKFDITERIGNLAEEGAVKLNSGVKIKQKFQSKALGLAGNVLGLASGALSIASAATNDQMSIEDKVLAIASGSVGLATTTANIGVALVDSLAEGLGKLTTRVGVATSVIGILVGGIEVAKAGRALDTLYKKGNATPEQIQLAQAGVADAALQVVMGFTALALSAICPPAALLTLLLPNFQSITQAVQLKGTTDQLSSQGLSKDAEAVYVLYQIAALNATPIVNWFSLAYSPKMKNDQVGRIDTAWLQAAVKERLSW